MMADEWSFDGLCRLAAKVYEGLDPAERREWQQMGRRLMERLGKLDPDPPRRPHAAKRMGHMDDIAIEDGRTTRHRDRR